MNLTTVEEVPLAKANELWNFACDKIETDVCPCYGSPDCPKVHAKNGKCDRTVEELEDYIAEVYGTR